MMQLFGDVDKKMQEDRKAVEQAHGVLKTSLEDLGKNTDSKFTAIQQSLEGVSSLRGHDNLCSGFGRGCAKTREERGSAFGIRPLVRGI